MLMAAKLQQDIEKRVEQDIQRKKVRPKQIVNDQNLFT